MAAVAPDPDRAQPGEDPGARWADALAAAALIAVDPAGLGGVALRARAGPVRERWLAEWRGLLAVATPVRRMPLHIGDDRLLGGLDLAATLRAGRPVAQPGLLTECDGGALLVAMAERLSAGHAARLAAAMDTGEVCSEREGLSLRGSARFAVIALDEGDTEDETLPAALVERLAFAIDLETLGWRDVEGLHSTFDAGEVQAARARLGGIGYDAEIAGALCAATQALGIASPRAAWLAWRAACASAALRGNSSVEAEDASLATRLVLAARATQLPVAPESASDDSPAADEAPPPQAPAPAEPPPPPAPTDAEAAEAETAPAPDTTDQDRQGPQPDAPLREMLIDAAMAAIPAGLLAALRLGQGHSARSAQSGRADAWSPALRGGRPVGSRRGDPRGGARLSLVDTLRAAAPWQALRRAQRSPDSAARIEVQSDDFRVVRRKQRRSTTTLFVIDASGSAALHRLAEAKGAVNLLLADCYVRRDSVAVLAFRGRGAELLLPPTRSLVRAKRSLAALPGGGGTPLAAGIDAALNLAMTVMRSGGTPVLVFLTDGRANIALDGSGGRAQADSDALRSARRLRSAGLAGLVIDTSPKPAPAAQRLAAEMSAQYSALPYAGAQALSLAVRGLQAGVPRTPGGDSAARRLARAGGG